MTAIHRVLLRRLLLAWFAVSALLGGGVFLHGIERIDDQVVELARAESQKFAGQGLPLLNTAGGTRSALETLVEQFAREHFVFVEIYDAAHQSLVERVNPRHADLGKDLAARVHRFPQDHTSHYERFSHGERTLLQVMVPLRDDGRQVVGYFEGIFVVDPETLARLYHDLQVTLLTLLGAVMLTTLILYPVVISLHRDVARQARELLAGNVELMEVLGGAIAKRDSDTHIHNYRVSIYAVHLAEAAGLGADAIRTLIAGAFLHDVGKIGIPDAILLKPARLTAEEFAVMQTHVALGVDILAKSSWLQAARDVVEYHHEKYDGRGYARGLAGEAIPINARIFAIVDVFDALTSKRPYKEPMPFAEAMAIIERDAGSHFDPRLVASFADIAPTLHAEVSGADDATVEARLKSLIGKYYFAD